jgi:NTE family protein
VSNSPLDQVVEIGGLTGKNVFVVNLWADKRALPRSIPEVLARRDEIVFAEKIRRNIRTWGYIDNLPKTRRGSYVEPRPKNSRAD